MSLKKIIWVIVVIIVLSLIYLAVAQYVTVSQSGPVEQPLLSK
jgi:hypothetical protein